MISSSFETNFLRSLLVLLQVSLCSGGFVSKASAAFVERTSARDGTLFLTLESYLQQEKPWEAKTILAEHEAALVRADPARFYAVRGHFRFLMKQPTAAQQDLRRALELKGMPIPALWHLILGRVGERLGNHEACRGSFAEAQRGMSLSGVDAILFASCLEALGDIDAAWKNLVTVTPQSDQERTLVQRAQGDFLVRRGLVSRAIALYVSMLDRNVISLDDAAEIASQFRRENQSAGGMRFLEIALRVGVSENLLRELARCQIALQNFDGAAETVGQIGGVNESYLAEAAELFRRAGKHRIALDYNSRLPDSSEKIRQRFALLLELKAFDEAIALIPFLERWKILDQDEVRYGVAFACFQTGELEQMEKFAEAIRRSDLKKKVEELQRRAGLRRVAESVTR